jgi:hypothetical protein
MYFLREKGMLGAVGGTAPAAEVKVDGKTVGAVTDGSYIFAIARRGFISFPFSRHYLSRSKPKFRSTLAELIILISGCRRRGLPDRTS